MEDKLNQLCEQGCYHGSTVPTIQPVVTCYRPREGKTGDVKDMTLSDMEAVSCPADKLPMYVNPGAGTLGAPAFEATKADAEKTHTCTNREQCKEIGVVRNVAPCPAGTKRLAADTVATTGKANPYGCGWGDAYTCPAGSCFAQNMENTTCLPPDDNEVTPWGTCDTTPRPGTYRLLAGWADAALGAAANSSKAAATTACHNAGDDCQGVVSWYTNPVQSATGWYALKKDMAVPCTASATPAIVGGKSTCDDGSVADPAVVMYRATRP